MANTNSAAARAGDRGNACVLEGCVSDYPPFNIVDASIFEPYRICSREETPARVRVVYSKARTPRFTLPTVIDGKIGNIMTESTSASAPDGYVRASSKARGSASRRSEAVYGREQRVRPRLRICVLRRAENKRLGQPESRVDCIRWWRYGTLPHLVGRWSGA